MPRTPKPDAPLVARGTVIKLRRLCGKPNCMCVDGQLHESWALSYSLECRTRMIMLSKEVVPVARMAVKQYRKAAKRLEAQALQGIRRLHAMVEAGKRRKT